MVGNQDTSENLQFQWTISYMTGISFEEIAYLHSKLFSML